MKNSNDDVAFVLPEDVMRLFSKLDKSFVGAVAHALIAHYEGDHEYDPEDPAVDSVLQLIIPAIDAETEHYRQVMNDND